MKIHLLLLPVLVQCLSLAVFADGASGDTQTESNTIRASIVAAGVPAASLDRIQKFIEKNHDQQLIQEVYTCKNQLPSDLKPCDEKLREKTTKKITITSPQYVAVVDFSKPSNQERFFLINLKSGTVQKFLTTHGRGSGVGPWAYKFSNIKDSEQSSLGLYHIGEVYQGSKGSTLRMYGLETSNDQAYSRDVVIHSAWYATPDFITSINPKTGKPFGRLGVSWGCPAVAIDTLKKIMPLLKGGGIIDLYQPDLMDAALSGKEVQVVPPTVDP